VLAVDIIVFAVIAAYIFWRYRSILGQRSDDDVTRPPPAKPNAAEPDSNVVTLNRQQFREVRPDAPQESDVSPNSLAGTIRSIQRIDQEFDEKAFLTGARHAFGLIVTAFAKGDKALLQSLLATDVFKAFEATIDSRAEKNERLEFRLDDIRSADLVAAAVKDNSASLSVEFISEQQSLLYNSAGELIEGEPNRITEVVDTWTFERKLKDPDPTWRLVTTHSAI
jgi:predicted lipid-binding transport protein (Tim44 family)